MKKQIFFLLVLFCLKANAQKYYPLIRENIAWQVWYHIPGSICGTTWGGAFFFKGDTIYNNQVYKKIYKYPVVSLSPGSPFCSPYAVDNKTSFLAGFMREDTTEKKVYIYDEHDKGEGLLYDFTLRVGDFVNNYATKGNKAKVDSIKMITLLSGEKRRKFFLSNRRYYIESIGSSAGLQYQYWGAFEEAYYSGCFYENNKKINNGKECAEYLLASKDLENQIVINISPNPFVNTLSINIENNETMEFKLYDVFSKNILQKSFQNAVLLDTSTLPNGTYFYQLSSKKGILKVGKLLKTE